MEKVGSLRGQIRNLSNDFEIQLKTSVEKNLVRFCDYFEFCQLFHENTLPISSLVWAQSFQSLSSYLQESKEFIKAKATLLANQINSYITSDVEIIANIIKRNFTHDANRMTEIITLLQNDANIVTVDRHEAKAYYDKLQIGEEFMTKFVDSVKVMTSPELLTSSILHILDSMSFQLQNDVISNISKKLEALNILEQASDTKFSSPFVQWSNIFKTVLTNLQTESTSNRNKIILITSVQNQIMDHVDSLLNTTFYRLQAIVNEKSNQIGIDEIEDDLKQWRSLFVELTQSLKTEMRLSKLIMNIYSNLSILKVNEPSIVSGIRSLDRHEKNIGFLKSLKGDNSDVMTELPWKTHIIAFNKHIDNVIAFSEFLTELYNELSSSKIQKDVSRYDVDDFSDWGKPGSPQGIHVDKSNFQIFLSKLQDFHIKSISNVSRIIPSDSQLLVLKGVLEITLKKRIVPQCTRASNSTIRLKANFIRFSDFLDSNGKPKFCGWESVASVEIYALDMLLIDMDLIAIGQKLELYIVAPIWVIVGERKIVLDGSDGDSLPKAKNGIFPGGDGENGEAGLPGGSAGTFFGVATTLIRGEQLVISANGGIGGPGQEGGDGGKGEDGEIPPFIETCSRYFYDERNFSSEFKDIGELHITGHDAKRGGIGGSCGIGGEGGLFGGIKIVRFTRTSRPKELSIRGETGKIGYMGKGGSGGSHGSTRLNRCVKSITKNAFTIGMVTTANAGTGSIIGAVGGPIGAGIGAALGAASGAIAGTVAYFTDPAFDYYNTSLESRGTAENGSSPRNCSFSIPKSPSPARESKNVSFVLRLFKNYLIQESKTRFMGSLARRTVNLITTSPEVQEFQDVFGLIEDHKLIEIFPRETNTNIFLLYETHLNCIEYFAAQPRASESGEIKKVLSYLYTASLAKLFNLRTNRDSDLVIDVAGYLNVVSQNVKRFSSELDKTRTEAVIMSLKKSFKDEVDKKIDNAEEMIKESVNPEMENIVSQYDNRMERLISETIALQHGTINKKAELTAKKQKLVEKMVFNSIVKVVGVIIKTVPILGNVGDVSSAFSNLVQLKAPPANITQKFQQIGLSALELSNSIRNDMKNIQGVKKEIEDTERVLENLRDFEKRIYEKLLPMIEKMGNDLNNTVNNLHSKSSVSLDIASWKVQDTLKDTSIQIQHFTHGYTVHDSVLRLGEKLEAVMTILIKIYDRIQNYQEQQKLFRFLAHLSSAAVAPINVTNPQMRSAVNDLQISIRSNIVLNEYKFALVAFKQWIFPFAERFLGDFQLPQSVISNDTALETLVSDVSKKIESIRAKTEAYKTKIESFDKHIYLAQFTSNSTTMEPFYVWKNEKNRDQIKQLFEGKTVLLKADIMNSPAGKDAIKFNFIKLGLKANDPQVQAAIDKKLLSYEIVLTHTGVSNYRYNDQFVSITSPSQSIRYSFEKLNGKAVSYNNVYRKLLLGDIILSPYTFWQITLTTDPKKSGKFEDLSQFSNSVDLILEGSGSFVKAGETDFHIENYYEIDDSIRFTF